MRSNIIKLVSKRVGKKTVPMLIDRSTKITTIRKKVHHV